MAISKAEEYNDHMAKSLIDQIEEMLDRKLDERFDAFEDKLDFKFDSRFDAFEDKLDLKFGAFMEHMDDKFDSLAEALQVTVDMVSQLPTRDEFNEVKADVTTIKLAVRDTNRELHGL